jgi:hypothetical protein
MNWFVSGKPELKEIPAPQKTTRRRPRIEATICATTSSIVAGCGTALPPMRRPASLRQYYL